MKKILYNLFPLLFFLIVIGVTPLSLSCEPGGDITFQNQQNNEVTIFFTVVLTDGSLDRTVKQGVIPPNSSKIISAIFLGPDFVVRIEGRDPLNKLVFSHDYKMADLDKIGWKITIPP